MPLVWPDRLRILPRCRLKLFRGRMDPISRSTYGFCQGLDGLEMTSVMPMPAMRCRKTSP